MFRAVKGFLAALTEAVVLLCLTACHRTLAKHLHTGLPWIKCFLRHHQNDANGTADYLHKFVSNDIFRILGINVNSTLVQLTQPTTLPPNTSVHTHETEEGLDALLVACSQQYKRAGDRRTLSSMQTAI